LKKISIAASQTAIPCDRFGINNPHNAYFLSLKPYTEHGGPDWKDPADIHNQRSLKLDAAVVE